MSTLAGTWTVIGRHKHKGVGNSPLELRLSVTVRDMQSAHVLELEQESGMFTVKVAVHDQVAPEQFVATTDRVWLPLSMMERPSHVEPSSVAVYVIPAGTVMTGVTEVV